MLSNIDNKNNIICPICKKDRTSGYLNLYQRCGNCSLIFYDINYNMVNPGILYEKDYFMGEIYKDYIAEGEFRTGTFIHKLKLIDEYISVKGSVLDIGCATGIFLNIMRERHYDTYGIDISDFATGYARDKFKLNVKTGYLSEAEYRENFFDLITLWDVLEHLTDPVEILTEVNRILKKSGIIVIETLNRGTFNKFILKENWPLYRPPYHLLYFDLHILKDLMSRTGFRVLKIFPVQTYFKTFSGYKSLRYFHNSVLRKLLGRLFNDVVLLVAEKNNL